MSSVTVLTAGEGGGGDSDGSLHSVMMIIMRMLSEKDSVTEAGDVKLSQALYSLVMIADVGAVSVRVMTAEEQGGGAPLD